MLRFILAIASIICSLFGFGVEQNIPDKASCDVTPQTKHHFSGDKAEVYDNAEKSYRHFVTPPSDRGDKYFQPIPLAPVPYYMEHNDKDDKGYNNHPYEEVPGTDSMSLRDYLPNEHILPHEDQDYYYDPGEYRYKIMADKYVAIENAQDV